jgi:uncharacterized RDD family membrane protein YckC
MKPAHLGKRLFAHIIDLFIIMSLWMLALMLIFLAVKILAQNQIDALSEDPNWIETGLPFFILVIVFISIILLSVIFHLYFITYEFKYAQTLGKKWMHIKVVQIDGSPITRQQAVQRDVAKVYFELLFTVPLLYIFMNPQRQRLGDKWSKTIVVEAD